MSSQTLYKLLLSTTSELKRNPLAQDPATLCTFSAQKAGSVREKKKGWQKRVGVKWGGGWGGKEEEVNNECSKELLRPWRGLRAFGLLVAWWQKCRSVEVRASGHFQRPSGSCWCLKAGPQDTPPPTCTFWPLISQHWPSRSSGAIPLSHSYLL